MDRDEIYLVDMWRLLVREWRWLALGLVIGLVCALAFSHLAKRQWEANAWILIGQVGQVPPGQDPKVEPIQRVLERLQFVPFQNEVLQRVGLGLKSPDAGLFRKSMKLEPLPYAGPLVKITLRATSQQLASQLATATVEQLRAVHQKLSETPLALAHARLGEVQSSLSATMAERDHLQQAAAPGSNGKPALDPAIASVLLSAKNDEVRNLEQARSDIAARLSSSYTYETSLMWPVYVPDRPAFPNPVLTWGVGMLFGLCLGGLIAVTSNAMRHSGSV